ncbi:MAG TPA: flavodoxin family protein [Bacteroidales bacterium]|nr:flavodoxin family protein [Bacteroidales bacterium]
MKKVLVLDGSTRKGNTSVMVEHFKKSALKNTCYVDHVQAKELNIEFCNGCLRCNLIKRCSISGDDWNNLSQKISDADILVFASPIYFHYVSAPLKKIIDRFRSFVHVQITEEGVKHTPWNAWQKDFVLLLSMGSSNDMDAQPVVDLFEYITEVMGESNRLYVVKATRLAFVNQILKPVDELAPVYKKLNLPEELAIPDAHKNKALLESIEKLGFDLTS